MVQHFHEEKGGEQAKTITQIGQTLSIPYQNPIPLFIRDPWELHEYRSENEIFTNSRFSVHWDLPTVLTGFPLYTGVLYVECDINVRKLASLDCSNVAE